MRIPISPITLTLSIPLANPTRTLWLANPGAAVRPSPVALRLDRRRDPLRPQSASTICEFSHHCAHNNTTLHICILCLLCWQTPLLADTITGRVERVIDGDTVIVENARVRLAEIDAPELSQPHGPEAKMALADMITGKRVTVTYTRRDRYGRLLATIHLGHTNINLTMVEAGHAWRYRYARKTGMIAEAERSAMARKCGIWSNPRPKPPWQHRKPR